MLYRSLICGALLGDRGRRVEALDDAGAGPDDDQRATSDEEDDDATGDDRFGGGALPRAARHEGPRRTSTGPGSGATPGRWRSARADRGRSPDGPPAAIIARSVRCADVRATMPVRCARATILRACARGLARRRRSSWLAARAARGAAHGPVPPEPPTLANILLGWTLRAAADLAHRRRRSSGGAGPSGGSTPRTRRIRCRSAGPWRSSAGMAAIAVALMSGIERYDTTLFSVHMVQHLLLMLVAAPLLVLAAPVTLLLRLASPGDAPARASCRCCTRGSSRVLGLPGGRRG